MTTLERDGVTLFYIDQGEGEPAMLFVHGWSGDHTHFAPQLARFGSTHRVISVDLRGHGASAAPDQPYTIEGFADDLAWMCDRLDVAQVIVIGHSMGGSVSLALAAHYPDLVSAVVLLDSPLVWPPAIRPVLRQGADIMAGPDCDTARKALIDGFFLPTDDSRRRTEVTEQMMRTPRHVAASAFMSIATWDHNGTAAQVKARVLAILAGSTPLSIDEHFPPDVVENLTIGRTVGAGHYIQLEAPDEVNAMIERFLEVQS